VKNFKVKGRALKITEVVKTDNVFTKEDLKIFSNQF
jgi:hypothetical protein